MQEIPSRFIYNAICVMSDMIKRLLKKYKYPPEGMDDALETVMTQCELWTDNNDMEAQEPKRQDAAPGKSVNRESEELGAKTFTYAPNRPDVQRAAEKKAPYGHKHPGAK